MSFSVQRFDLFCCTLCNGRSGCHMLAILVPTE